MRRIVLICFLWNLILISPMAGATDCKKCDCVHLPCPPDCKDCCGITQGRIESVSGTTIKLDNGDIFKVVQRGYDGGGTIVDEHSFNRVELQAALQKKENTGSKVRVYYRKSDDQRIALKIETIQTP